MTPATITLIVFLIALALFIADFLPMGLVVIAILIASSVAVCTPLAIPANSMILEPGNLRFKDFFKPGIVLSALAFALSMILLPLIYPFFP